MPTCTAAMEGVGPQRLTTTAATSAAAPCFQAILLDTCRSRFGLAKRCNRHQQCIDKTCTADLLVADYRISRRGLSLHLLQSGLILNACGFRISSTRPAGHGNATNRYIERSLDAQAATVLVSNYRLYALHSHPSFAAKSKPSRA